jgi:DNA-binding CsgD family transcriptional regulator/tetratricopeptide (TPR) repeat protein
VVVRDCSGGGASGVLHDVATGSPTWTVLRHRLFPGLRSLPDLSSDEQSADTLLLVEDLHLADRDLLAWLHGETTRRDRTSRLMVVGVVDGTRPAGAAGLLRGDVEVVVPPLTVDDVGTVVETSTGTAPRPRLAMDLHTMTGGRVDLLTSLLHGDPAGIRSGRHPVVPDDWSASLSGAVDGVTGTTESRRQLTAVLRAVAVAGGPAAEPVPLTLLRDLDTDLGVAGDEVFSRLLRTVPGPAVVFRDPRHRAVVLEQTPPPVSAALHERAAGVHPDPGRGLYHRLQAALAGGADTVEEVATRMLHLAGQYRGQGRWRAAADVLTSLPDSAAAAGTGPGAAVDALTKAGDLPAARLWSQDASTPAPATSYLAMHAGERRRAYAVLDHAETPTGTAAGNDTARQRALLAFADWEPHAMLGHAGTAGDDLLTSIATSIVDGTHTPTHRQDLPHRLVDGWLALVNDDPLAARELLSAPLPAGDDVAPTLRIWRDAWLARTHYVLGDFETARRTVERGLATGDAHGSTLLAPVLLWTGAQVAAFQGDHPASRQYTSRLPDDPESFLIQRLPAAMSRMITTATSSDLVAALRVGESLARIGTEKDTQQPGFWPWEDVYAQCLVRAGKIRAADAVVAEAEQRAGGSGLSSVAAKLRVPRGSILLRRGDVDAGVRCFDEAVEIISDTPMRAYQSRILLEYGQVLRRLGRRRRADEVFARAEEVFVSMGAPAMVERCRRERRAAGVTLPRGGDGDPPTHRDRVLTTQEEQIAVMAADGSTNRDIARELTLSTKTVEHHLTNCYRKLGVSGRTALSEALQRR